MEISSNNKAKYDVVIFYLHRTLLLKPLSVLLFPMGLILLLIDAKNKAVKFRLIELLF